MLNTKGFTFIHSMFGIVLGLILMVAFLPLINDLVSQAISSNMSALSYGNIIQLLLGLSGLLMVFLFIWSIVNDQERANQGGTVGF